ncbi:lipopolysaccharide biosynthesis protein [Flavobacterium sp. RHBU_3]|uniref:lipopolysaccharide biosynthesis protein n=1 Tax=Flavobacterium sp. RHBU_3 TaxID=3391184 RepID=UPI003984FCC0
MEKKRVAPVKQVVLFAIFNYLGTAIGVISTLFIYPKDKELLGTIRYIDNLSQLLCPIMVLGASQALIKFYPALDERHQKQLFNYSIVSVLITGLVTFLGLTLYANLSDNPYVNLAYYAFPIAIALAFVELFKKQLQDLQRIAVPSLFEKIIPKVVLPAVFLFVLYQGVSYDNAIWLYIFGFVFIALFTGVYLFKYYKPGLNYRFKTLFGEISRKDYFRYSLYALAGSLGSLLAFRIDGLIIPNYISIAANGTFSIGSILASTLQIPAVGMFALYAPIISTYLKDHNLKELDVKYKEIARLLFFIGAVLYGCIFLGIEDLFRLMPDYNKLKDSIPIVEILGFSVLINMATGFNSEIITYSKYYRFNLIAVALLIVLTISLNILLLEAGYGIIGVAWASFISMTVFNISKLVFIYKKFGLLPFDGKFFKMGFIFLLAGFALHILPQLGSHLFTLVYKTGVYIGITVFAVYKLRLVYQLNVWVEQALKKFGFVK